MNSTGDHIEELAGRLSALRDRSRLSGAQIAGQAGWHPSKVSRIAKAGQVPSATDVTTWARICGLPDAELPALLALRAQAEADRADWRARNRRGQAAVQRNYTKLVSDSKVIRHFETVAVPGLLQTPDYCRRMLMEIRNLHGSGVDDLDEAVAERLGQQRFLYDTGKRFEFLLAEPVLRWLLVPRNVMRGQLDRLCSVIGVPHIRIGVLPLGVPLKTIPQNSFVLYDDIATAEGFVGDGVYLDRQAEFLGRVLDQLWEDAAEGAAAQALIAGAAEVLTVEP
jgi:hypothetical protein